MTDQSTERSVVHASFTLERTYPSSPARVFSAWADPRYKIRWFAGGDEQVDEYRLDFRVGGQELARGTAPGDVAYVYEALYQDIVPNERFVFTYQMHLGEPRCSVSLATVELRPDGTGTHLLYTEHGAFLDGLDDPKLREAGTVELLNALGKALESEVEPATHGAS
jgi:uncharacterized protein YndB with AHSA1/START domain